MESTGEVRYRVSLARRVKLERSGVVTLNGCHWGGKEKGKIMNELRSSKEVESSMIMELPGHHNCFWVDNFVVFAHLYKRPSGSTDSPEADPNLDMI